MKRLFVLLTLLLFMLCLGSCGQEEAEKKNVYQVYHLSNSGTRVEAHSYEMQAVTESEMLEELITCLSTIPEKLEYKAPLAMGFQLLNMKVEDGKVLLNVDAAYGKLPVTTEVLVRAAIVRTLTQLEGISFVAIRVDNNPLKDSMGEVVGWMSADLFIDNDGSDINTYELIRVKLYFANETGDKLIAAYREKHYSTNTSMERFVVEELLAGPSGQVKGLYPTINPQTKIINVLTKDGICYVNLDENFLSVVNNVSTGISVYSIVNSLVELKTVNKVQILINGEVPAVFTASVFERNLDHVITLDNVGE